MRHITADRVATIEPMLDEAAARTDLVEHGLDGFDAIGRNVAHAQIRGISTQRPNTSASASTTSPSVA